jgi:hypothetical protein
VGPTESREHAGGSEWRLVTTRGRRAASTSWWGVLWARTSPWGPLHVVANLGQMAPSRPTAPTTARRPPHHAPAGPGLPRRGSATAQGPHRVRSGSMSAAQAAETGQNGPKRA